MEVKHRCLNCVKHQTGTPVSGAEIIRREPCRMNSVTFSPRRQMVTKQFFAELSYSGMNGCTSCAV